MEFDFLLKIDSWNNSPVIIQKPIWFLRLNTEVNQLRRDRELLTTEVEEYRTLAERRRDEIEALHVDFKRLTEQLAEANAAKCEALVRSEDIGEIFPFN